MGRWSILLGPYSVNGEGQQRWCSPAKNERGDIEAHSHPMTSLNSASSLKWCGLETAWFVTQIRFLLKTSYSEFRNNLIG